MNQIANQISNITVMNVILFLLLSLKHSTISGKILTLSDERTTSDA